MVSTRSCCDPSEERAGGAASSRNASFALRDLRPAPDSSPLPPASLSLPLPLPLPLPLRLSLPRPARRARAGAAARRDRAARRLLDRRVSSSLLPPLSPLSSEDSSEPESPEASRPPRPPRPPLPAAFFAGAFLLSSAPAPAPASSSTAAASALASSASTGSSFRSPGSSADTSSVVCDSATATSRTLHRPSSSSVGASTDVVLPRPSCPLELLPHTNSRPVSVRAAMCRYRIASAITPRPSRSLTTVGSSIESVLWCPSVPFEPSPHVYTEARRNSSTTAGEGGPPSPSSAEPYTHSAPPTPPAPAAIARSTASCGAAMHPLTPAPADTRSTCTSSSDSTSAGTFLRGRLSRPSAPLLPSPQLYTLPSVVSASPCEEPVATSTTRRPTMAGTSVGVDTVSLASMPRRPSDGLPHVYSCPSAVTAAAHVAATLTRATRTCDSAGTACSTGPAPLPPPPDAALTDFFLGTFLPAPPPDPAPPVPCSPLLSLPAISSAPALVTTPVTPLYDDTCTTGVDVSVCTACGLYQSPAPRLPSCPSAALPHAYTTGTDTG
mmetsp:Transcript_20363/g.65126  ORF Transcript_20363/g.65126 Transcript_20363/m.65126 type:complete len:553 (+) Transcript_20363:190-1848(+)